MQVEIVARLLQRELRTLRQQVELYPDDRSLCVELTGSRNPGGNLALHLCGNLQHFIGGVLGGSGYVRDREAEFQRRDLNRAELLREIDTTMQIVDKTLRSLRPERWEAEFPLEIAGQRLSTPMFLTHLCVHLGYHLGQLDAHRRAISGNFETPPALSPAALATPA